MKKIALLNELAEQTNVDQLRTDATQLNLEDFLKKHPILIRILLYVLPILEMFTGKTVDIIIEILIAKLTALEASDDAKTVATTGNENAAGTEA